MKFVNRLTHEDVLNLVPFYHVYDFEESKSLQPELRHFKIQPVYGGAYEDVTIGDRYGMGSIRFYGVKEDKYVTFMFEKFGKEYIDWLKDEELKLAKKDIEEYSKNRMEEYCGIIKFCQYLLNEKK